jgi:protein involved in polysaccharide export with SLBB domain
MLKPAHLAFVRIALGLCIAGFLARTPALAETAAPGERQVASQSTAMRPAYDDPRSVNTDPEPVAPVVPDYRLGTGDKIHITVYGEDDLGGIFQVDAKGFVQLPLVGPIVAAGGTAADLEKRLAAALSDGYVLDPRVNVEVTQYRPFYVIGQVGKPGQYDYVNEMSVPNAIALAGGYTIKAVDSWVYIRHANETVERRVPADETTKVEPGDVLRVPDTAFWSVMDVLSPLTSIGTGLPRPY